MSRRLFYICLNRKCLNHNLQFFFDLQNSYSYISFILQVLTPTFFSSNGMITASGKPVYSLPFFFLCDTIARRRGCVTNIFVYSKTCQLKPCQIDFYARILFFLF